MVAVETLDESASCVPSVAFLEVYLLDDCSAVSAVIDQPAGGPVLRLICSFYTTIGFSVG